MGDLQPPTLTSSIAAASLSPQSLNFAALSRSPQTWRAYSSDWRQFSAFAACHGRAALPADPATVSDYCSHLATAAGRKPATIARALAAISQAHHLAGLPSPTTSGSYAGNQLKRASPGVLLTSETN